MTYSILDDKNEQLNKTCIALHLGTREAKAATSAGGRDPWKMLQDLWNRTMMCCWKICRKKKSKENAEDDDSVDLTSEANEIDSDGEELETIAEGMVSCSLIWSVP